MRPNAWSCTGLLDVGPATRDWEAAGFLDQRSENRQPRRAPPDQQAVPVVIKQRPTRPLWSPLPRRSVPWQSQLHVATPAGWLTNGKPSPLMPSWPSANARLRTSEAENLLCPFHCPESINQENLHQPSAVAQCILKHFQYVFPPTTGHHF